MIPTAAFPPDDKAELLRVQYLMREDNGPRRIFVFGSNLAGIHGAGAAKWAELYYGAMPRRGIGPSGNSYAIPTKDHEIETLPLMEIASYVKGFMAFAKMTPGWHYVVTRVGCGLAGFTDADMARLFIDAPRNCFLPIGWRAYNFELDHIKNATAITAALTETRS